MNLEHKFAPIEAEVDEKGVIEGYASRFGIKDQGGDIVVKGAFGRSIGERKPKMLWQHDPSKPIGKWVDVKEDATGLSVRGQINLDVQAGREAHALIKDGAIDGMSIGYRSRNAVKTKDGRELRNLDLWEISLVTFPMLKEATIDMVKSLDSMDASETKNFLEKHLRDAGFSRAQAKQGASLLAQDVLDRRDVSDATAVTADDLRQIVRGLSA